MSEKFWVIKGTKHSSKNKQALKSTRTQLNTEAGVNEKDILAKDGTVEKPAVPNNKWPFQISKGPDHPKL